ncbi:hypothetical protein [Sphingomonas jaspsi]|uniref:hypothetical protein n=1 Tax=Sphingomonas jaspsi TaxID=392409 RepID=UPI0004BBF482|nr:hypothetical protein [Sphingomonas jaspsi]
MTRTAEHEKLIDELVEKTGLDRKTVADFTDKVIGNMAKQLVEKAAKQLIDFATENKTIPHTGGVVEGRAPMILTNEYVVPRRSVARLAARSQRVSLKRK